MEEIFFYVDEAGNPNLRSYTINDKHFSIGAAVFTEKISEQVIFNAIESLKESKALSKTDQKTIARGYFHASYDGPEAHSKLMIEANKIDIDFYLFQFDKQLYSTTGGNRFTTEQDLHHHLIHLAAGIGLNYGAKRINLIVAERDKSFPTGCEQRWKDSFYNELIFASIECPFISTHFPELNVHIVNGTEPGIQLADLILWATSRNFKEVGADDRWFNRIRRGSLASTTAQNDPVKMLDFHINGPINVGQEEILYNINAAEIDGEVLDEPKMYKLITETENAIREAYYHSTEIDHLRAYLKNAVEIIERKEILTQLEITDICRAFLMIFDTVALYKRSSTSLKKDLLLAKRIAANIAGGRDSSGIGAYWGRIHPSIVV
ncbi:DUF3800 domain-containing protein [Paenibacillus sp. CAU 1782]